MAGLCWSVYVVRAGDGTLYTGVTTDVARRVAEHRAGGARASRYLRGRGPLALVFEAAVGTRSLALEVERALKRLPRGSKERLIERTPGPTRLLELLAIEPPGDPGPG